MLRLHWLAPLLAVGTLVSTDASDSTQQTTSVQSPPTSAAKTSKPTAIKDADSYAVYATLASQEWTVTEAHATQLVFQAETTTSPCGPPKGTPTDAMWRAVMADFDARNSGKHWIVAGKRLGVPYVVVTQTELDALFRPFELGARGGWNGFYDRYPDSGGLMAVSAVGFDPTHERARVYMGHSCGGLCGGGTDHFLQKTGGVWKPARVEGFTSFCFWAS
jgi:hypothetical protein